MTLGDAVHLILKHPFFKGILDADPIEISSDTAVSSGVQAHNPHAKDYTYTQYISISSNYKKGLSQQSIRHQKICLICSA